MFSFFAKKSEELVNVYKNDLTDFTNTLTKEAGAPLTGLLGGWFDGGSRNGRKGDVGKNEFVITKDTFLQPISPEELNEATEECEMKNFEEWKTDNPIEEQTERITEMIKQNPQIENLHKNHVPHNLEYSEFWSRYFYRREIFKIKKEKRETLKKLVQEKEIGEDLSWDDDEDDVDSPRQGKPSNVQDGSNGDNIMVEEFRKMLEVKEEEIKTLEEKNKKLLEENTMLKKSKNVEEMVEQIEKKKQEEIDIIRQEQTSILEKLTDERNEIDGERKKIEEYLHTIYKWIIEENEGSKNLQIHITENLKDSVYSDFEEYKKKEELNKTEDYGDWE